MSANTLLRYEQLRDRGITLSKCQIWRLEKAGKFPLRVNVSAARVAWIETEIDEYLRSRVVSRKPVYVEMAAVA